MLCIYSEQAPVKGRKAEAKMPGAQATLEAYWRRSFGARPGEVEDMIQRRQEESGPEEREEGPWTERFCLGE